MRELFYEEPKEINDLFGMIKVLCTKQGIFLDVKSVNRHSVKPESSELSTWGLFIVLKKYEK